ncbi:MAG: hypothetical protein NTY45_10455, partial [Elusimicrobia bacterium]|nr:hypothetical protein [Elusimicrobiota bacterium]
VNLLDAAQTVTGIKTFTSSVTITAADGLEAARVRLADNVAVSVEASPELGAGVRVSSNVYIVGFASAAKYFGDGSGLTNMERFADNLGNHIATTTLNMAGFPIIDISSLTVTGRDENGYSLRLSSGINMPGGRVEAGLYAGSGELLTGLNAANLASGTVPLARLSGLTRAELAADAGILDTQLAAIETPNKVKDSALSSNVDLLNADQTVTGIKTFTSSVTVTSPEGLGASRLQLAGNVAVSAEVSPELGGGVRISSNVYILGFSSAARYFGDGSGLTNLPLATDNLGNHIATTTLNMAGFPIMNVSSLSVTGRDENGNSLWLSSGIHSAGGRVEAGLYAGSGELLTGLNADNLASGTVPVARLSGITSAEIALNAGILDSQLAVIEMAGKVKDTALSSNVNFLAADQTVTGVKTYTSSVTVTGAGGLAAARLQLADNAVVAAEASPELGGGVRVSTNVYIVGFSSAAKYYGDGSALTNLPVMGDDLGSHIAARDLDMSGFQVLNVSSLTVIGKDASGYSLWLSSGINMAGGRVEAGLYAGSGELLTGLNAGNLASGTVPLARLTGITSAELSAGAGILDTQLATIAAAGKVQDTALSANVSLLDANQTLTGTKTFASSVTITAADGLEAARVRLADNVAVSAEASPELGAGVRVSSNVYIVGFASAAKFFGDGSGLSNMDRFADNLGNHIATTTLNMAGFPVINVSSLAVTGRDENGYSLWLSSGIYMAGGRVEAGLYAGSGALLTDLNAGNLASGTVPVARLSGITSSELSSEAGILDTQLATIAMAGKVRDTALSSNVSLLSADQTAAGIKTFTSSVTITAAGGLDAARLRLADHVVVTGDALPESGGGVRISSNVYRVGFSSAAKYYGDGSGLTNMEAFGDNLGNHIATTTLNMANFPIVKVSTIVVTGQDENGYSLWLSSGINMAAGRVEAGLFSGSGELLTGLNAGNLASGTVPVARLSGITSSELSAEAGILDTQLATIATAGKVSDSALSANVSLLDADQTVSGVKTFSSSVTVTSADGLNAPRVRLAGNVVVASGASPELGGGVSISSNVYIVGFASATKYYGDGSGLTNVVVPGDNLGNHIAETTLDMAGFPVINVSSLAVTGQDENGYSLWLSSGINMAGGRVEAGLFSGSGELLTGLNAASLASGTVPLARLSGLTSTQLAPNAGIRDMQLATISTPGKVEDTALSENVSLLSADQTLSGIKTFASSVTVTAAGGLGVSRVRLADNVVLAAEAAPELGAGVRVSSNVYIVGFASAAKFFGDGSGLTNMERFADNLGNHIATTALNMADFQIVNVSSLTVTGRDASGYSLWLSSGINMAGGRVEAGLYSGSGELLTGLNAANLASGTVPLARLTGLTSAELAANAGILDTQLATIAAAGKVSDSALSANVGLLNADQTASGKKTFTNNVTVTGLLGSPKLQLADNISVSSEALAELGGGVRVSSNVYVVGFASAAMFFGDGSGLTNMAKFADNLGNHIATTTLNMAGFPIVDVSSLTVAGKDESGYSLWLSSGINMAGGRVEAGLYAGSGELLTGLNAANLALGTVPLARLSGVTRAELAAEAGILDTQLATIATAGKVSDSALSANVSLLDADQTVSGIKTFTSSVTVTGPLGAPQVQLAQNVSVAAEADAELGGGVRVSSNVYVVGFASAAKFFGDGSGLSNMKKFADNLGNHIATTTLNMAGFPIVNVSSLTVAGKDASGYSLWLSSGINMAGGRVEAGLVSGSGELLTGLNAANLASGTVPLARLSGVTRAELAAEAGILDTQLATIATAGKVSDSALSANVSLLAADQTVTGVKTFVSSVTVAG